MTRRTASKRHAFSLMEIMVAVSIVGLMAAMASQQYFGSMDNAREHTCELTKAEIEVQAQRFHRHFGRWPQPNLGDIRRMRDYFPDGLNVCPVDGSPYQLNPATHEVIGHIH